MVEFWAGAMGVLVGAVISYTGIWMTHHLSTKKQNDLDARRKVILLGMLKRRPPNTDWRKLSTLAGVVGANFETTTRLLIELGARGSETGNDTWALLSEKPLP